MNELDRFFQNEVKAYEEELKKIDEVLGEVLPTFSYCQVTHCKCSGKECKSKAGRDMQECQYSFVYQITQHAEESGCLVHNWSTSTNAMMLNIVSYLQKSDFNSLFIKGSRSLTLPQNLRHKIKNKDIDTNQIYKWLAKCFLEEHSNRKEPLSKGFHDSRSYGTNPWCTLSWFGEIILFRKRNDSSFDSNVIDLWCKIVAERFRKHLERAPQKSFEEGISGMRAAICYKILEKLYNLDDKNDELKKQLNETHKSVSDRLRPILLQRIYQHITSFEISDGLFDPGELAFSMEGLVLLDDGRHYLQEAILERFYKVMTDCLNRDVFWRATKPVNIGSQGGVILPISAEVASSLLRTCHMVSKDPQHLKCFREHREVFRRYTHWVLSQKVEVCTITTLTDRIFLFFCKKILDPKHFETLSLQLKEHLDSFMFEGSDPLLKEEISEFQKFFDEEQKKFGEKNFGEKIAQEFIITILNGKISLENDTTVSTIGTALVEIISRKKTDQLKDLLSALFPFFKVDLRQALFFELEKSSSVIEDKIKNIFNQYFEGIQPIVPVAVSLYVLKFLLENKLLNFPSDAKKFYLEIKNQDDFKNKINPLLGEQIASELIDFINNDDNITNIKWHGWHSEHAMKPLYNSRFIHLWATREYFIYLMQYRAMLCSDMAWELIERNDFKVDPYKPPKYYLDKSEVKRWESDAPVLPSKYWKDTVIPGFEILRGTGMNKLSVYNAIWDKFLKSDRKNPDECAWSMLLYGPPGTGKSTIAEKLSEALGWPLITITPSDFIRQGEAQVEARAKQIFRSLMFQQDAVVLFDEIDRLLLDRDAPMYFDQHDTFQFMTPGMLVKLKDLWRAKRVVFIICTNYEERIDMAAKRKGRIDHSFLVLPPDGPGRMMMIIRELLKGHPDIKKIIDKKPDIKAKFVLNVVKIVSLLEENYKIEIEKKLETLIQNTSGFAVEDMKTVAEKLLKNNSQSQIASAIKSISEVLVNNKQDPDSKTELKKFIDNCLEVLNKFDELDPAQIRLESYLHRFRDREKEDKNGHATIQTSQQPFDEVIGLLAMMGQDKIDFCSYFQEYPYAEETLERVFKNLLQKKNIKTIKQSDIIHKLLKIRSYDKLYKNSQNSSSGETEYRDLVALLNDLFR
jgi:hypothetical protein